MTGMGGKESRGPLEGGGPSQQGSTRGTHFASLRLRCAPLGATPQRLPFSRDPIPSEGPWPEAVAPAGGPETVFDPAQEAKHQ
jgi:hypothetical protein